MRLYADSSALLKLVLDEPGSDQMETFHASADSLTCAAIGYVELRAGLAMAARTGRVNRLGYADQVIDLRRLWRAIVEVPLDENLLAAAGNDAETYALRASDAIHLAALQASGVPSELGFACWDRDLREAAGRLGYELLPGGL